MNYGHCTARIVQLVSMKNFWKDLPVPFSVLAPMDGVTDSVFRQIIVRTGKPDVLFTEFTNCDGLMSNGRERVIERLKFQQNERPIVAQIWGINPKTFYESAQLIAEMGFDGIDLNMGCPHRTIIEEGACSALIKNPGLSIELIQATKEGGNGLPVSVKTRIGFNNEEIEEWIGFLLRQNIDALTIHLRTVSELSKVPARWEYMPKIVALKNSIAPQTKIIGNGDVQTIEEGKEKTEKYKPDGIMYGTAIFSNPWLFNTQIDVSKITPREKMALFLQHINLFKAEYGSKKNFFILKKYCKIYIQGFDNAAKIREAIMIIKNIDQMESEIKKFIENQ